MKKLVYIILLVFIILSVNVVSAGDVDNETSDVVSAGEDREIIEASLDDGSVDSMSDYDKAELGAARENVNSLNSSYNPQLKAVSSPSLDVSNSIKSNDVTKYYKSSVPYKATFYNEFGDVLSGTYVRITANGVSYSKKTNDNGFVSLNLNLKPGTYLVTSENPLTGYKLTTKFIVKSTIDSQDISKVQGDSRKFSAKFYKSSGKVLANKKIKFKLNGKIYKVKTNSKGIAELSLENLKKGTYKIISYNADGLKATNKIKVVKYTTTSLTTKYYTFLKSDKKVIKVKLLNKFGYAPGKGKIIYFKINGKKYSAKTDSAGVAKIKLPSLKTGIYTVTYTFKGNIFYKKSTVKNKVAVIPTKNPTFKIKSTTTFGYGAGTPFKVQLNSGKVPLANRLITFKVDGKKYAKTTDGNGIASLPVNLAIGKYVLTYTNKKDSKVNSKTGSTQITVKERQSTVIEWKSATTFNHGVQTYKLLIKDSNNNILTNRLVKLTVNSKTYSATTASNGYATFTTNLLSGNYKVSYNYPGSNEYASTSGNIDINVVKNNNLGFGYYVLGKEMKKVDLNKLASQGTGDLFLNYYAITLHGKTAVEKWIGDAGKLGMRVHIWQQVYYTSSDGWTDPVKGGSSYLEKQVNEALSYAKIKGVAGVHFDYLRYNGNAYKTSGGSDAINNFVKKASSAIHGVDSKLIVSCALMPETDNLKYYYGQDYSVISNYMDVVMPLIYKGTYGKDSNWVYETAKWFVDNSKGAKVWVGLQGYYSDNDIAKLPASDLTYDVQKAVNAKSDGAVLFRYTLTNHVNFNSISNVEKSSGNSGDSSSSSGSNANSTGSGGNSTNPVTPDDVGDNSTGPTNHTGPVDVGGNSTNSTNHTGSVDVGGNSTNPSTTDNITNVTLNQSDILDSSKIISDIIKHGGIIPKEIIVGNSKYSPSQFLYSMAKTVENIITGGISKINVINSTEPQGSNSFFKTGTIYKSEYINMAMKLADFMEKHNVPPKLANSTLGDIGYANLIDMFSRILSFYNTNGYLPNMVAMTSGDEIPIEGNSISISNIINGALQVQNSLANNKILPVTVTTGGVDFTLPEFLYLMSQAIYQISNSNKNPINYFMGVKSPKNPYGGVNIEDTLYDYVDVAKRVANYMRWYGQSPSCAGSDVGDIHYVELVDAFSRILIFYSSKGYMPTSVGIHYI